MSLRRNYKLPFQSTSPAPRLRNICSWRCPSIINCKYFVIWLYKNIKHVQIQSFDNYMLVISLTIRQWSNDLKHLILGKRATCFTSLAYMDTSSSRGGLEVEGLAMFTQVYALIQWIKSHQVWCINHSEEETPCNYSHIRTLGS